MFLRGVPGDCVAHFVRHEPAEAGGRTILHDCEWHIHFVPVLTLQGSHISGEVVSGTSEASHDTNHWQVYACGRANLFRFKPDQL